MELQSKLCTLVHSTNTELEPHVIREEMTEREKETEREKREKTAISKYDI